jgi:hypothetical protein
LPEPRQPTVRAGRHADPARTNGGGATAHFDTILQHPDSPAEKSINSIALTRLPKAGCEPNEVIAWSPDKKLLSP